MSIKGNKYRKNVKLAKVEAKSHQKMDGRWF